MDGQQEAYTNTGSTITLWEALHDQCNCFCFHPPLLLLNLLFGSTFQGIITNTSPAIKQHQLEAEKQNHILHYRSEEPN